MPAVTLTELMSTNAVGLSDPYTTEKWRLVSLPTIGGITLSPLACEEIELPFPVFTDKSKEVATTQIHWPQGSSIDGFSSQWHLDQTAALMKYFQNWQMLIQNPYTGGMRMPSVYKKILRVALFDIKGNVIATSEVRGCWPIGLQPLQLNGTGGRGVMSLQFKCDAQRLLF